MTTRSDLFACDVGLQVTHWITVAPQMAATRQHNASLLFLLSRDDEIARRSFADFFSFNRLETNTCD